MADAYSLTAAVGDTLCTVPALHRTLEPAWSFEETGRVEFAVGSTIDGEGRRGCSNIMALIDGEPTTAALLMVVQAWGGADCP